MLVMIEGKFDASHFLTQRTEYNEKCMNLHGHSYKYSFTVEGEIDDKNGMVIDFGELKHKIVSVISEEFDHKNLNDILANPTAENVVMQMVSLIKHSIWFYELPVSLVEVSLTETEGCKVTWRSV